MFWRSGSANAQQQVITSTGQGMQGEIITTQPKRQRGQNMQEPQVPPPGSAPGTVPAASILVLGDSLSAEYGIARGKGWVALLSATLQAERPDVTVINASLQNPCGCPEQCWWSHMSIYAKELKVTTIVAPSVLICTTTVAQQHFLTCLL